MKKTLAWLLTLFMVLTISTVSVFAADTDVAKIGETGYASLTDAIAALNDGDTLTIFEGTYDAALTIKKSNVTVIGQGDVVLNGVPTLKGTNYRVENIDFNYSNGYNNLSGSGLIKDCTFTATENTFRYCYGANNGSITFEGTTFNPASGKWAVHFDSASGTDLTFTNCVVNGRVALGSDLGSLTATGTEFNKAYVNVWGTEDGATFENCEFNDVPYVFTGYDADNKFDFNDCTVVTNGNSANVADIIYGGIDNADAKIYEDEVLIGGAEAQIGDVKYPTLQAAIDAAVAGDNVAIIRAGTYKVPTGKNLTITGAVDGVVFDNIGAHGMGGASVTFNNVTFNYAADSTYKGLQHSGDMVYNKCTINGQVFLYGNSETFNDCTFNNTGDNYNVWTYGAKEVVFNECTFNSDGKSVLVYNEGATHFIDVTVENSKFNATAPVDGKAAIEIDTSLTAGANINVDATTTATGFGTGSKSGNSLWNNKKGNDTEANNDITVAVAGETVLKPVILSLAGSGTAEDPYLINNLEELIWLRDKVNGGDTFKGKVIKLTADIDLAGIEWTPIGNNVNQFMGQFDGNNKTISNLTVTGNNRYVGLFGYIKGDSMSATAIPSVKNLNLTGVNVSGDYYVGALAGQAYVCNITNVHVSGNVTGTRYVGGLVGHVYTYFKDCSFTGNASCTFDALGGIAGAGDCRAYDCKVIGNITGSNWVGGIVGNGQEGTSAVGCYVKGTVSSDKNYYRGVGGIAGVAGHGYSNSEFKNNYFDGEVYLCGEKVDAIIMGIVNADNNDSIGTTVEGNSWNTEYYPATTPVYVVAEISSSTATAEEWIAGASEEKSDVRNNNLVMLESDLAYVDAEDVDGVTIMQFSDVTEDEVTQALLVNNNVARITDANGTVIYYETLEEALKAVTANATVELLHDITITSDWDNRNTGAKIAVPVTIDGNGYTLKFTGMITDGYNYLSAFRFEAAATVKDLTIDLSEATSQWAPRLRAISAKTDITIDNCTFIGNAAYNNTNAVIIGEGAGAAMGDVVITITNSTFTNWRNGISDNQNGQDAKTVTVTGNTFNNANARIAAKNSVVFNNNTMNNGGVTIASFTTPASLAVTAKGNTLATGDAIVNEIKNANTIDAQTDFVGAVATVNGTIYGSLEAAFAAAANNSTVTLIADVDAAVTYGVIKTLTLDLNGYTIESDAAATLTAAAGKLTIVDNSTAQTGSIVSNGNKAIHSSASVAIQSGKFVGTITTANGQADDSQVCITGGNFSVEPNANIVKHTYVATLAEDGTYNVVMDEYKVIINGNGATVSGEGFYNYGEIVYINAVANGNCIFAGWLSDDVAIQNAGSANAYFAMPDHAVTVTAYWATSGAPTPVIPVATGTLRFETNGGSAIDSITGVYGTKVDLTKYVPTLDGYTFTGWYSDKALTKPVTEITLSATKTVYAGWIQNAVTPDIPVVVMPFTDVAADAYYYNAVLWAVNTGITTGMTDTMFGPDLVCTRAQVVTFLWRAAGCPVATNNDMPFADVSRDLYYYEAVLWAVEMGITNGISDTEFAPDAECSRAQIVTFLWRALGAPDAAADAGFVDVDADAYYATAVEWAVDNGITNGMGDNTFGADADCTRGQTVTFLFRFFCK